MCNYIYPMKAFGGNGGIDPPILKNLVARLVNRRLSGHQIT